MNNIVSACPTGKRQFPTQADAKATLSHIRSNAKPGDHIPVRVYKCNLCPAWHLTSQERRDFVTPIELNTYLDMPFEEYLADTDYLSNSMIKKFSRSPAHYQAYINEDDRTPTRPQIVGRAAHAKVLEPDYFDRYYYVISDDLKKPTSVQLKAKKPSSSTVEQIELWNEALELADGRELIKESSLADVESMRGALLQNPKIRALITNGSAEQTRFWKDQATNIPCKMRADFVHGSLGAVIVDYKTCEDARPEAFAKAVINYGYDIQGAHYVDGGQATYFFVIAQEKAAPFAAQLYLLTSEWIERGETLRRKYLNQYAECRAQNYWPAYPADTHSLVIPRWAQLQENVA